MRTLTEAEYASLVALARFGKWVLDTSREYITDVEAGDIQDTAESMELLEPVLVCEETRCGDDCECDDGDFCYRYTELAILPEDL